jgi:hypothetical protein
MVYPCSSEAVVSILLTHLNVLAKNPGPSPVAPHTFESLPRTYPRTHQAYEPAKLQFKNLALALQHLDLNIHRVPANTGTTGNNMCKSLDSQLLLQHEAAAARRHRCDSFIAC